MPKKFDDCVKQVRAKGNVDNEYAVCRASMGTDRQIKARAKRKRSKKRG